MKLMINIDEKQFRDIQRISEVQLKRRTPTLEQVVANGTLIEQEPKTGQERWICPLCKTTMVKYPYPIIEQEPILDKIRAEIEKTVWEDVVVSLDGTDEVRIPRLEPDDVFEIIDKYRQEE